MYIYIYIYIYIIFVLFLHCYNSNMVKSVDARSWTVLTLFCLFSSSNAIQWITFASIATPAREFFHLSTDELNQLSSIYMIIYAVGVIFTCSVFEQWGVRRGILIGSALNALGSTLKFAPGLFYPSFTTMMIPQTINSIAQLFVLSTPPLIAAHYFPPHRRVFATAVASTSNSLGNAIALLVPPFVVKSADKRSFMILFGGQMVYCCLVFVGIIFFFYPPRNSCNRKGRARENMSCAGGGAGVRRLSLLRGWGEKTSRAGSVENNSPGSSHNGCFYDFVHLGKVVFSLFKSCDYILLLLAFSISTGSIWTFASVLTQILEPFGVDQETAGIVGAVNIVVGTIAAYGIGVWVGRSRNYKATLLICFFVSILCCFGIVSLMLWASANTLLLESLSGLLYVVAGIGQNAAIPICFEFCMEITHPMPDSVPSSLFMAGANIVSLILLSVSSGILGSGLASKWSAINVVLIILFVSLAGGVCAIFPAEKLRRHEAEQEAQLQRCETLDVINTEGGNHMAGSIAQRPQFMNSGRVINEEE